MVLFLALGGSVGAFLSAYVVQWVSNTALELFFLSVIVLSLAKLFYTPHEPAKQKVLSPMVLVGVGVFVGVGAISIGVGGAIFIIPFLNAYLGYPLKKAVVAALFFVAFSSVSALMDLGSCTMSTGWIKAVLPPSTRSCAVFGCFRNTASNTTY